MILITGGAGYIGSHCVLEFVKNKIDEILIFDNLETGHIETIETLQKISNKINFIKGDLKNFDEINSIFKKHKIDGVIHFAAYSLVQESVENPCKYYQNNTFGTLNLLKAMVENQVLKIVFSSTAAVYGEPKYTPIDENHPKNPINPYGVSKLMVENIMDDFDRAYNLKSIRLRYFNVVGADSGARVGEWHNIETHLVPNILKSTFNQAKTFKIFGDDYKTKDGTCIRDYIDIEDLAQAHRLAYEYLKKENKTNVFNLGSEKGCSVKEIFECTKDIVQKEINYEIAPKRQGDPAVLLANSKKAQEILNWQPKKTINESIKNAFNWEEKLQTIILK